MPITLGDVIAGVRNYCTEAVLDSWADITRLRPSILADRQDWRQQVQNWIDTGTGLEPPFGVLLDGGIAQVTGPAAGMMFEVQFSAYYITLTWSDRASKLSRTLAEVEAEIITALGGLAQTLRDSAPTFGTVLQNSILMDVSSTMESNAYFTEKNLPLMGGKLTWKVTFLWTN